MGSASGKTIAKISIQIDNGRNDEKKYIDRRDRKMKKLLLFLCSVLLVLGMSGMAGATEYNYETTGLNYLDGSRWYTWGIDMTIPEGETITNASLTFRGIYAPANYDILYGDLLDYAWSGVNSTGGSDWGDHFATLGATPLFAYQDATPYHPDDFTYTFGDTQIIALNNYADNGNFGFGLDPDCWFSSNNVTFSATSSGAPVPEPTTMLLLGCGLAGLGFVRKKRQKA